MYRPNKRIKSKHTLAAAIVAGIIMEVIITLIGCLLLGKLMERGIISGTTTEKWMYVVPVFAVMAGGIMAELKSEGGNGLLSITAGVIYWVALFLLNTLIFKAEFSSIAKTLVIIISGSLFTAISESVYRERKRHTRYKNAK